MVFLIGKLHLLYKTIFGNKITSWSTLLENPISIHKINYNLGRITGYSTKLIFLKE